MNWRIRHEESGVALLMVLVAVLLMTVVVMDTRAGVNLFEDIAVSSADELQTYYLARSGLSLGLKALEEDEVSYDSFSDDWAAANKMGAVPVSNLGWVTAKLQDEEGKLDINRLVKQDGTPDDAVADRLWTLLYSLGLPAQRSDEIVDGLIDWIDPDGIKRPDGAEDEYYTSLANPYSCPNRKINTIGEIGLVKGIGNAFLFRGEGEVPALANYITIYGDPEGRININTASVEVLMSLTPEGSEYVIDRDVAQEIVDARFEAPFKSTSGLKEAVPGIDQFFYNQIQPLIDVASSHFSVDVVGETERASSRAYGILKRTGQTVKLVYYRGF
ncbi:MAG: type II secretion system minor pseudopilin GspK [bacterium]